MGKEWRNIANPGVGGCKMSMYPHLLRGRQIGGLPITPSTLLYYDGINNYTSVDNSGSVGNPYDFERTNAFSLALMVNPAIDIFTGSTQDLIAKSSSTAGYFLNFSSGLGLNLLFAEGGVFKFLSAIGTYGVGVGQNAYIIATYDGGSNINTGCVIHVYDANGSLSQRLTHAGGQLVNTGGATLSGTIKNTSPVWFGRNPIVTTRYFIGMQEHYSIWSAALNNTQSDELALRMFNNTVTSHSVYSSSCVGYWRDVIGNLKILNAKNATYNATLNNF